MQVSSEFERNEDVDRRPLWGSTTGASCEGTCGQVPSCGGSTCMAWLGSGQSMSPRHTLDFWQVDPVVGVNLPKNSKGHVESGNAKRGSFACEASSPQEGAGAALHSFLPSIPLDEERSRMEAPRNEAVDGHNAGAKSVVEGVFSHAIAELEGAVYCFGGMGANGWKGSLHSLREVRQGLFCWSEVSLPDFCPQPEARYGHTLTAYCADNCLILFGGDGAEHLNDLWMFSSSTSRWSPVDVGGDQEIPSGRAGHSAVIHGSKLFIFGGWRGRESLGDLWMFDFDTKSWTEIQKRHTVQSTARQGSFDCSLGVGGRMRSPKLCCPRQAARTWSDSQNDSLHLEHSCGSGYRSLSPGSRTISGGEVRGETESNGQAIWRGGENRGGHGVDDLPLDDTRTATAIDAGSALDRPASCAPLEGETRAHWPPARHWHVACVWRGDMYIQGGMLTEGGIVGDMWKLDLYRFMWHKVCSAVKDASVHTERCKHVGFVVGNSWFIHGGRSASGKVYSHSSEFYFDRLAWSPVYPTTSPYSDSLSQLSKFTVHSSSLPSILGAPPFTPPLPLLNSPRRHALHRILSMPSAVDRCASSSASSDSLSSSPSVAPTCLPTSHESLAAEVPEFPNLQNAPIRPPANPQNSPTFPLSLACSPQNQYSRNTAVFGEGRIISVPLPQQRWHLLPLAVPLREFVALPALHGHALAVDERRKRAILLGGCNSSSMPSNAIYCISFQSVAAKVFKELSPDSTSCATSTSNTNRGLTRLLREHPEPFSSSILDFL